MTAMSKIVVLERIEPGAPEPDYCIHGRATCMGGCGEWVWLGHATFEMVNSGEAQPLCLQCATGVVTEASKVGHVRDHRRADGPHD